MCFHGDDPWLSVVLVPQVVKKVLEEFLVLHGDLMLALLGYL